ncbi:MAG: lactonase family protein [Aureispira sp.]|nr:lactonase family protein [Aureispira sp.]
MKTLILPLILFLLSNSPLLAQNTSKTLLFIGSYTEGEIDTGIYVYEFDANNGSLNQLAAIPNLVNPSFLTLSPNGKFLYACTETKLEQDGSVSAFEINPKTGQLKFLNKEPAGGRNPVHVSVHKSNRFVINSNYTDASISVFKTKKDGRLNAYKQLLKFEGAGPLKKRQSAAHIHSAVFSPNGKFLFAPDLGADLIRIFKFQRSKAAPLKIIDSLLVKSAAGSGPRHFVFHPNKKFGYCMEELSGSITAFSYKRGKLRRMDSYFSYSKKQASYGSSDIHISPDGKFLYASNRWYDENTISIFEINQPTGRLKFIMHQATFGDHPRSFVIDPSGHFLLVANQASGNIVTFKRDFKTGLLTKLTGEIQHHLPSSLKMKSYNRL